MDFNFIEKERATVKYIIMANGRGTRWKNFDGHPKHLIKIEGETLLKRTTRLVHTYDNTAQVIIASSNPSYETEGADRHAPLQNDHELDRFCYELIESNTCFLYGDVFYSNSAMEQIVSTGSVPITFFGTHESIFAIKVLEGDVMLQLVDALKHDIVSELIHDAKGWDLYHKYLNTTLSSTQCDPFILIQDATRDFNTPEDYLEFSNSSA